MEDADAIWVSGIHTLQAQKAFDNYYASVGSKFGNYGGVRDTVTPDRDRHQRDVNLLMKRAEEWANTTPPSGGFTRVVVIDINTGKVTTEREFVAHKQIPPPRTGVAR
jgi:hypothetical protein